MYQNQQFVPFKSFSKETTYLMLDPAGGPLPSQLVDSFLRLLDSSAVGSELTIILLRQKITAIAKQGDAI